MDMIRAQEQKRDLHDQFQHQVGMSGLSGAGTAASLGAQSTAGLVSFPPQLGNKHFHSDSFLFLPLSLQLKCSNDSFSVIADYFGRGVFNKLTLLTDPPTTRLTPSLEVGLQRDLLMHSRRGT